MEKEIVPEPVQHTVEMQVAIYCPYCKFWILVFPPTIYGPRASRLGYTSMGKKLVRNLEYDP